MTSASVDVVIVSYRCRELLERCLTSIAAAAGEQKVEIRVVDNASADGTVELLRTRFPGVHVLENRTNEGFARAQNAGIAQGHGDFVLVLNPDTEIFPGTLEALLTVMADHPEVGICGCRLERPNGTFDHASKRSFPTPLSALGHFLGIGRRMRSGRLAAYRATEVEEGPVDAVNGAFMLIRREALRRVGSFDERYWMYMEDLDLCRRFKDAGWLTWYEPRVVAVHHKGGSASRARSPRLIVAFHSGMVRWVRSHRRSDPPAVRGALYAGIAVRCVGALLVSAVARLFPRPGG